MEKITDVYEYHNFYITEDMPGCMERIVI